MVTKEKKEAVKKVEQLCKDYPIIGVVNMQNLPMAQLQRMRKKLSSSVQLFMTKKRLMTRALEGIKEEVKGIEQLEAKMNGIPALLFTKENPFRLYSLIQKNKSKAAAKPGQIAPNDIKISAGPTPFAPGPIISELGNLGLKTSVQDGKVAVMEDAILVKEGEEISEEAASLLAKLNVEPMEVGLDLVCVYEGGDVFGKDILAIDEDEYERNVITAYQESFNLAVEAGIFTQETTELLIQKSFREAKSVALEGSILTDETKEELLAKAEREATALNTELDIPDVPEQKPEDASAEPNQEAEKAKEE